MRRVPWKSFEVGNIFGKNWVGKNLEYLLNKKYFASIPRMFPFEKYGTLPKHSQNFDRQNEAYNELELILDSYSKIFEGIWKGIATN